MTPPPASRLDTVPHRAYDVVILGGGLAAAGAARDAAMRGLSVALFESQDFGGSWPDRLVVAGAQAEAGPGLGEVRRAFRERDTLLRIAPGLVRPVEVLIPFYDLSLWRQWRARMLTLGLSYTGSRDVTREELLREEPSLNPVALEGGLLYRDGVIESPARLAVANIVDAIQHGATALNYVDVSVVEANGPAVRLRVRDRLEDREVELSSLLLIAEEAGESPRLDCVLEPCTGRGLCVFSRRGTARFRLAPVAGMSHVSAESGATVEQILRAAGEFLPEIRVTAHWVEGHQGESAPDAQVRILPGPPGTYRLRAGQAVDRATRLLGRRARGKSAFEPIIGTAASMADRLIRREQCHSLTDYIRNRSELALTEDQGLKEAPRAAVEMALSRGWTQGRIEAELIHHQQWVVKSREPLRRLRQ